MKNRNYRLLYTVLSLLVSLLIAIRVLVSDSALYLDGLIISYLYSIRTEIGLILMKLVTFFGSKYFFILALVLLSIYFYRGRQKAYGLLMLNSIVSSYLINALLKIIFTRTRPLDYMAVREASYSFPSGHAMVSMSFYTTMTYIILDKLKKPSYRPWLLAFNFLLVFLIGFSRLYLGVHWPSDVAVGYLLGYLIFIVGEDRIKK